MPFHFTRSATVTPNAWAIPESVSPLPTMYLQPTNFSTAAATLCVGHMLETVSQSHWQKESRELVCTWALLKGLDLE